MSFLFTEAEALASVDHEFESYGFGGKPLSLQPATVLYPIRAGLADQPREVAQLTLFLGSDRSSFVTGETINVDGGIHINWGDI